MKETRKETSQLILEASQTDDRCGDVVDKILARTILETMPDEFVRYGLYTTFGLGNKPTAKTKTKLAKWRKSNTAQVLYGLWRGDDYQPKPLAIPTRIASKNSPICRVFTPIVESVSVGEAMGDCIEFSQTYLPLWINPFSSNTASKDKPIAYDDKPKKDPSQQLITRLYNQHSVINARRNALSKLG